MSDLIFGYTWEQIQRAQQGGRLSDPIPPVDPNAPILKDGDLDLLEKHGMEGLEEMEFYGVIDRLKRAGITNKETP
jgi:hypothetical protein